MCIIGKAYNQVDILKIESDKKCEFKFWLVLGCVFQENYAYTILYGKQAYSSLSGA